MFFSHPAATPPAASPYPRKAVAPSSGIRALLLIPLFAVLIACGTKDTGPPPRYAVVRFENLSGDPTLEWTARGASELLSRSLQGTMDGPVLDSDAITRSGLALGSHPPTAPGVSTSGTSAMVAGANRIITGYVQKTASGVRITASEENATSHRSTLTKSVMAGSAFDAMNMLAREFTSKPAAPPTTNAEAFRLYCTALEGPTSAATPLLEQAVQLDPSYGRAWVALARVQVGLGDRDRAAGIVSQARTHNLAPSDRANLDFEDAQLRNDRPAMLVALRKMHEIGPADLDLARSLAEAETVAGNFGSAAAVWKNFTVQVPTDPNAWNQLGYSLSWSGDYNGALAALREYAKLRPDDPNPLDSQGDVHYWFGKFAEAAASYAAAQAKTPAGGNGIDLYKGAWARFRTGDKPAAEALYNQFQELRRKAGDQTIILLTGDWLYRTRSEKEAFALMRTALAKLQDPKESALRASVATQLTIWDLLAGDRLAAAKDSAGSAPATPVTVLSRFAAMPAATAAEWEARAARLFATPQLAPLRATALGYALLLDGKKQAAIPVWEGIVSQSPGTDFLSRSILTRLKGEPIERPMPPDASNLNPFLSVLGKL